MPEFHGPEQSEALQRAVEEGAKQQKMDQEEVLALQRRMEALDKFFADRVVARYKIEVQFGKGRSTWQHFAGALSLFLSGTKLNGGGDEKLYMCPGQGCKGVIFPNERLGASVVCRTCEMVWPEAELIGEKLFRLAPPDWAHVILEHFIRLEHNADIYLKFHRTDIRHQTMMEQARKTGRGEILNQARRNRGLHIYPLKNIIKDTKHGADLYKRILTFIKA
jgi:hypothetical protein